MSNTQPAQTGNTSPAGAGASDADSSPILQGVTASELDDDNNWYDHGDLSARRDQTNAEQAVKLGRFGMAGYPLHAQGFGSQLPHVQAQIAALPGGQRERYTGTGVALTIAYENTSDPKTRDTIQRQFEKFKRAVGNDYDQTLSDPVLHTESLFNQPYGYAYLSAEDQKRSEKLEDYREDYHAAKTPEEREEIIAEASQLRGDLQNKIGTEIIRQREDAEKKWQQAKTDVNTAYDDAGHLEGENLNGGHRLTYFGSKTFDNALHARAFTEDYTLHPEKYKALRDWENDLKARDDAANDADRHRISAPPTLPPFMRFSDIARQPPLPNSQYSQNLLDSYQYAQRRMVASQRHIDVQRDPGGPLYNEYVADYSAPKPVWQQELDEGVCRFVTGMLPGVGLFTNQICPRSPMDDTSRTLIDIGAGATGGMLGTYLNNAGGGILGHLDPLNIGLGGAGSALSKLRAKITSPGLEGGLRSIPDAMGLHYDIDPSLAEAREHIEGPPKLPESYAADHRLADTGKSGEPGVGQDAEGHKFVEINDRDYYVQHEPHLNGYRAYSRDNPFQQPIPVEENKATGKWEAVGHPLGLKGGMPKKYSSEQEQEIADYMRAHPGESYRSVGRRFNVDKMTVSRIGHANAIPREDPGPLTPEVRAQVITALKENPANRVQIARKFGVSYNTVDSLAKKEGIEVPSQPRLTPEVRASVIQLVEDNPGATNSEISHETGVSNSHISKIIKEAGLKNARYRTYTPRVTPERRQEIVEYARKHPDERTSDLAQYFHVSTSAIKRVLTAEGAAPAPSAAFGSAEQQSVGNALRKQPNASYATIAQTTHTDPDAVRDYAEQHGLTRGGLTPDDNAPPLPTDLPMPTPEEADHMVQSFEPLTPAEKAEINRFGPTLDVGILEMSTRKPAWMISNYMKTPEYYANAGAGTSSQSERQLLDEIFGSEGLSEADTDVIDQWHDELSPAELAANLDKPENKIQEYLSWRWHKPGPSGSS